MSWRHWWRSLTLFCLSAMVATGLAHILSPNFGYSPDSAYAQYEKQPKSSGSETVRFPAYKRVVVNEIRQ
jgi:hypothetical protein